MFAPLLVQEIRLTYRHLFLVVLGTALLTITCSGMVASGIPLLSSIALAAAIVIVCATTPVTLVVLYVHYWRTMHGAYAKFTHTIPARGRTLFLTKAAYLCLWTFLSVLLTALYGALVYSAVAYADGASVSQKLYALWEGARSLLVFVESHGLTVYLLITILALVLWVIQMPAALSIGAQGRLRGSVQGGPVMAVGVLYLVNQIAGGMATFFIPYSIIVEGPSAGGVRYEAMLWEFVDAMRTGADPTAVGLASPYVYLVVSLGAMWWAIRSLEHHLYVR